MKSLLKRYWPELLVIAAVLFFFLPTLPYDFMRQWDDSNFILGNAHIDFTWSNFLLYWREGMQDLWTPLTMNSLMLDNLLWGHESPVGYRLVNILLHAGTALLFVRILRHLGLRAGLSFVCALIWAVHPQRVESVVWITERKDVLSGILTAGAFLWYMNATDRKQLPWGSAILYFLAVSAKPAVVGLPAVCAVYYFFRNRNEGNRKKLFLISIGLCILAGIFAYLLSFQKNPPRLEPPKRFVELVAHNLCFYISNTILPLEADSCYPLVDWNDFWIVPVFVLVFAGLAMFGRSAGLSWKQLGLMFLGFGIAFGAFFVMCSGGFIFNPTDYADRYSYLPALVVFAGIGFFMEQVLLKKPEYLNGSSVVLSILAVFSAYQMVYYRSVWQNDLTRLEHSIRYTAVPNDEPVTTYGKLAIISGNSAQLREAAQGLSCKFAIPDYPRNPENWAKSRKQLVRMYLSCAYYFDGNLQDSVQLIREFLKEDLKKIVCYDQPVVAVFKGVALRIVFLSGDQKLADDFIQWAATEESYKMKGRAPVDYTVRGFLEFKKENYDGALNIWREGLKEYPGDPDLKNSIEKVEHIRRGQR